MSVQDQEFVELDREAIRKLLDSRAGRDASEEGPARRRLRRWPFPGPVQIWLRDSAGDDYEYFGTCHDLNENGIGLYFERSLETGRRVPLAIHQPEATYHGEGVVRHCTPSEGEYFIGLEFVDPSAA